MDTSDDTNRFPDRVALFLPNLTGGGAERATVNLAAGFAERGVPTDLVLVSREGPLLDFVPPAVRLIDLNAPRMLRAFWPLAAYLKKEKPKVLLAALDHANLLAMVAARVPGVRTKTVISIHTTMGQTKTGADWSFRERAVPRLLVRMHRWADAIVAVSNGVAEDFSHLAKIPKDGIHVIPNAVITDAFLRAASEAAPHPWLQEDVPVVLGVGRLVPGKNFSALINAFGRVARERRARLMLLGDGPERELLEGVVRRQGLDDCVYMPGFVSNPYAYMKRASVLVLSSDCEGLPTVLIESLALGTPVVSTDCPSGPREILRDGTLGALVPVGNIQALSEAIAAALRNGRHVPSLDYLEAFTPDAVLDRYQDVFQRS
jgi:glycosyltransferase involved in cell wall biosynthesis